jgi:hypothetical protein
VHCVNFFKNLTWDHVFPESWYPETTPPNIEKWEIPSCPACNQNYGRLEEDLMIRIGLCLDPSDPRCLGIPQKAIRAISPDLARNEDDKRAREAKRKQILSDCSFGPHVPNHGFYPNFSNILNVPKEKQIVLNISPESVRKLNEKIVKGIVYLEDSHYIEPPFKISFYALEDRDSVSIVNSMKTHGQIYAREPGITVTRAVLPEDRITSLYFIDIWGRFKMYAHVGKS